jgi:hypothetical protein
VAELIRKDKEKFRSARKIPPSGKPACPRGRSVHCLFVLSGALQSFFCRKVTLSRGLHGDSFGCILHAVYSDMYMKHVHVMADGHENLSSAILLINTSQNSFDLAEHLIQLVENDTANITDVSTIS